MVLKVYRVVVAAPGDSSKSRRCRKYPAAVMDAVSQPKIFHPLDAQKLPQVDVYREIQEIEQLTGSVSFLLHVFFSFGLRHSALDLSPDAVALISSAISKVT